MKLNRHLLTVCAVFSALLWATGAHAVSATGSLTVQATVDDECRVVSTTAVDFSTYDPIRAGDDDKTGTIVIRCVQDTVITSVELDVGLHAVGQTRKMEEDGAGTNTITYELYKPDTNAAGGGCTAYANVWSTVAQTKQLVPSDSPYGDNLDHTYNVCGRAVKGQDVPTGTYSDTVTVTVNW